MRVLTEIAKTVSNAANSNAGSQIAGAVASVITTGLLAYILGKGEREREFEETKAKVAELQGQLEKTDAALKDCQERNSRHIERELRDSEKIGRLRSQYDLCQINNTLVRTAFKSSYCFLRSPMPENIENFHNKDQDIISKKQLR